MIFEEMPLVLDTHKVINRRDQSNPMLPDETNVNLDVLKRIVKVIVDDFETNENLLEQCCFKWLSGKIWRLILICFYTDSVRLHNKQFKNHTQLMFQFQSSFEKHTKMMFQLIPSLLKLNSERWQKRPQILYQSWAYEADSSMLVLFWWALCFRLASMM